MYPDEIKALSERTSIPIVGSELLLTRWQLREWLEKHVSQILMTEPLWTGGISETRKIANMAETFGVPLVMHNISGPIGHAAVMHLGAHIPNLFMVESVRAFAQTYFPVISNLAPRVMDGTLPSRRPRPGRGVPAGGAGARRPEQRRDGGDAARRARMAVRARVRHAAAEAEKLKMLDWSAIHHTMRV